MDSVFLKILLNISRQLAETRTLVPLLQYAVDVSLSLLNGEYGCLVLLNDDGTLDYRVVRDRFGNDLVDYQISQSILDEVVNTGEPVVTASALNDPLFSTAQSVDSLQLHSVLCVPLLVRGKVIGGLYVENRSQENVFSKSDLEPLRHFSYQLAVAIENARLNDELETRITRRTAELEATNNQLREFIQQQQSTEADRVALEVEKQRITMLTNFIQDATHQFRTPLTHISLSVDMLSRRHGLGEENRYARMIQTQVNTIVELVESMVLMARLDAMHAVEERPLDVNMLLHAVHARWLPRAGAKQQQLAIQTAPYALDLSGDFDLIYRAVCNLVDNAIKYSPEASTITISATQEDAHAVMSVCDDGPGVSPEDQPLIFSRFYRSDKAGTTRGFGLGLTIARKIAELHHGQLELISQSGHGSDFRLHLPLNG